jgi:hypothetical protein
MKKVAGVACKLLAALLDAAGDILLS